MTHSNEPLFLHEQVLLLALKPEQGTIDHKAGSYLLGLGGAIFGDLVLTGRLKVSPGDKRLVSLANDTPLGHDVLDSCLAWVAGAKKPAAVQFWVSRFSRTKHLKNRVARALCEKRVLREEEGQVLLFFKRAVFPQVNPAPRFEILNKLRSTVFSENRDLEANLAMLTALARVTGILGMYFDRHDLKHRKERLERITRGEACAQAVTRAVHAATAASVAALSTAMTAATAPHGHR